MVGCNDECPRAVAPSVSYTAISFASFSHVYSLNPVMYSLQIPNQYNRSLPRPLGVMTNQTLHLPLQYSCHRT